MEFKIENTEVMGLSSSIIASGNPLRVVMEDCLNDMSEKDIKRARTLGNTDIGSGHDQMLSGIIVQFDIHAPLYMWKEIQRYHFLDFISSQSTMHCLLKFDLQSQCNKYVWDETIDKLNKKIKEYNEQEEKDKELWYEIVSNVPSGFYLGARMTTNYRQLKTIYSQRKTHKLNEWREFCKWIEGLPMFSELCLGGE